MLTSATARLVVGRVQLRPVPSTFVALLAVAGLSATVLLQPHPDPGPHVPWWVLALLFAAVEVDRGAARSGAGPAPAGRVVLVVGLALTAPIELVVAYALGTAIGAAPRLRSGAWPIIDGIALATLATALGAWTYLELVERTDPVGPIGWFELTAAGLVISVAQLGASALSRSRSTHTTRAEPDVTTVLVADLLAIATGLVVVEILRTDPHAAWLLLLPAAAAYAVRHQYELARWRGDALTALHATARTFQRTGDTRDLVGLATEQARTLCLADRAELLFGGEDGLRVHDDGGGAVVVPGDVRVDLAAALDGVGVDHVRPIGTRMGRGGSTVVTVPIVVEGEVRGAVTLERRRPRSLSGLELDVLGTLVAHLAGALENRRAIAELAERHDRDGRLLVGLDRVNTELRRVSDAKTVFLSTTSHELRAPLSALLAETELLADLVGRPDAEAVAHRLVDDAATNARHLLRLVDDLLDLSRIEAGRLELRADPVDLSVVARRLVTALGPVLASDDLDLDLDVAGPVAVCGDEQRLWQVGANLVENARRATPAGGRVRVAVRREGTGAELVVEDTGCGIGAAELERIFGPFEQAGPSRVGLGLGLTIARHLVEGHGGTLSATSEVGVGSRFVARLPGRHLQPTSWYPLG